MLVELFPRIHARFSSLPLLGPHVEGFVIWLHARRHSLLPIRRRIREAPRVDKGLRRRGVRRLSQVSRLQLLKLAPRDSQDDIYLAALVRSLAEYFDEQGVLADPVKTSTDTLVDTYRDHLDQVRGFAKMTLTHHASSAAEFLMFLGYDADPGVLQRLKPRRLDAFIKSVAPRLGRESLQHTVAHLRSFLRFLVGRGVIADGLGETIDTPRVYRGERLPRALPWETVQSFLAAIDRSTPMGRRDYAMFLLITTYGLRTSEVAALRLDDILYCGYRRGETWTAKWLYAAKSTKRMFKIGWLHSHPSTTPDIVSVTLSRGTPPSSAKLACSRRKMVVCRWLSSEANDRPRDHDSV